MDKQSEAAGGPGARASTTVITTFGTAGRGGVVGGRVGAKAGGASGAAQVAASGAARASASAETSTAANWTLPPILIDKKARQQHNRYAEMMRAKDEQDVAEAAHKKAVARSQSMAQRQHLDTQVEFHAKLRRQNAEDIVRDRMAIEADLAALERETVAKAAKVANTIASENALRSVQVGQNRARVARAAAADAADDKERLRVQMDEAREEAARKREKQAASKRVLQKVQEENISRLKLKALETDQARVRDQEMVAENERLSDVRERQRMAGIEAIKAKIRAKFEAGGGDALEAGMAEKAAEDERRMNVELAKQDVREKEKMRAKKETAARLTAECHASVDQQIAMRRDLAHLERERKKDMATAMLRDIRDLKGKERLIKDRAEEKKHAIRDGIVAQMKADATRRWIGGKDDMPEHELKLNGLSAHA
eukprot:CAMPEP_0181358556 /NCGR_PEP_ID=MMETSP1106-20121128/5579_1 /TAXON_ID=81844 /ORGANISM="Mantoniella antarctica, Strain SL-175" /LENGTH=426 /DNA_ID=CAMNT_0023471537 /DNA_START=1 /DNA_END=1281 /DNA_ORIENTATION=-